MGDDFITLILYPATHSMNLKTVPNASQRQLQQCEELAGTIWVVQQI